MFHFIPFSLFPRYPSGTVKDVEIVCFACGEPGHKDYQCPKEKLQLFNAKVGGTMLPTGWWLGALNGHHVNTLTLLLEPSTCIVSARSTV